ncbi:mitochondrial outer membrane translocase complex, subunit Tom22 [Blastocladiella britannica]|nr:mitochondrial outer membrane translocase complex, subunit Tom22 [Blastocladiella britannica]
MVRLSDVRPQDTESEAEYSTDYDSEAESDFSTTDESLLDRLVALKDVVPPGVRATVASGTATLVSLGQGAAVLLGKTAWVLSTTALVMLAPLVYEMTKDAQIEMLEQEQRLRDQSKQELMADTGTSAPGGGTIVPPGF